MATSPNAVGTATYIDSSKPYPWVEVAKSSRGKCAISKVIFFFDFNTIKKCEKKNIERKKKKACYDTVARQYAQASFLETM